MSITTPTVHVPDATVAVAGWLRRHLTSVLVAIAVLATAALAVLTMVDGDATVDVAPHSSLIEQGSIRAIEYRQLAPSSAAADSLLDRSITAIDRNGR